MTGTSTGGRARGPRRGLTRRGPPLRRVLVFNAAELSSQSGVRCKKASGLVICVTFGRGGGDRDRAAAATSGSSFRPVPGSNLRRGTGRPANGRNQRVGSGQAGRRPGRTGGHVDRAARHRARTARRAGGASRAACSGCGPARSGTSSSWSTAPRGRVLRPVVRAGRRDHPDRQPVLPADRPGQPAGPAGRDDDVRDQPGTVRAARQQAALVLQLGDPGRVRDRGHRASSSSPRSCSPPRPGSPPGTAAKVIFIILAVAIQAVLPLLGHAAVLQGAALADHPVRGAVRGDGDPHGSQGRTCTPSPHGAQLGRADRSSWPWSSRPAAWAGPRTATTTRATCRATPTRSGSCSPSHSARPSRRRCWRSSARRWPPACPAAARLADRAHRRLPELVRRAVPDLRDRPAVRDQHPRPVLIGRHAAEPDPAAAAAPLRRHRHGGLRRRSPPTRSSPSTSSACSTGFLLFIILWLGPWCAIYLVDSYLRRNRYDHGALLDERGGRYFRNGGVHWPAIIAQLVGGVAARAVAERLQRRPRCPTSARCPAGIGGSDFSVFIGLIVGGAIYYLLARPRPVRAERRGGDGRVARPTSDSRTMASRRGATAGQLRTGPRRPGPRSVIRSCGMTDRPRKLRCMNGAPMRDAERARPRRAPGAPRRRPPRPRAGRSSARRSAARTSAMTRPSSTATWPPPSSASRASATAISAGPGRPGRARRSCSCARRGPRSSAIAPRSSPKPRT